MDRNAKRPAIETPRRELSTLRALVDAFEARGGTSAIIAVRSHGCETVSYGELRARILRLASALRARGLEPGDRVLLWAANSQAWIVAYFAIVYAGATAVPLDDQSSKARVRAVIEHAAPKLIVSTHAHEAALAELQPPGSAWMLLDGGDGEFPSPPAEGDEPFPIVEPDRIASLLYTSGTTGTPKAVPLTHANLISNLSALLDSGLVTATDRVLVPLPLHHAYAFTVGLLCSLGSGAVLILPSGVSGPELTEAAKLAEASALIAVPRLYAALWDGIVRQVRSRGKAAAAAFAALLRLSLLIRRAAGVRIGKRLFRTIHNGIGPRIELLGCGGAKLDAELAWNLEALGWQVLTGYGLTETSPVLTFNPRNRARLDSEGRPVRGVELRTAPVPDREHGEILARGPSVFSGYWHNPEETRTGFTEDGWFRTGDLGWIDRDGYLHIVGRSKEIIVLADGKNIFPEEIESVYGQSPLVREIAVLEHRGALVALVVPQEAAVRERGALREAALLREELDERSAELASYQRVADYRLTREPLPRTPLGKLQRHLLPERYDAASERERPTTSVELSEQDRQLLESDRGQALWQWLQQRYPERSLSLDTSPQLDLQIDSLEWVSLTLELQRRLGIALSGEAVSRIITLRDLLSESLAAPEAPPETDAPISIEPPNGLLRALGWLLLLLNRVLLRAVFRLRVVGAERLPTDSGFIVTPNHASYLDPLAVAAALPWRSLGNVYWAGWVGRMYSGPIMRLVSRATRVFPVDPDRDLAAALRFGESLLHSNRSLVWFPEGRRSANGELQSFLPGVGVLLEHSGARAVPTAVLGSFRALPRGRILPRPKPIVVIFGNPRDPQSLDRRGNGESASERISAALRDEVAALMKSA